MYGLLEIFSHMEPEASKADADDFTPEADDQYLTASLNLPKGGEQVKAMVKGRKRNSDGRSKTLTPC